MLALIGLIAMFLMAVSTDPETLAIGKITPMMNFATVRVYGRTDSDAFIGTGKNRTNAPPDYVSFFISDGTGRLQVRAYRNIAQSLCDRNLIPGRGMRVDVIGTVRVSGNEKIRLHLNSEDHIRVVGSLSQSLQ